MEQRGKPLPTSSTRPVGQRDRPSNQRGDYPQPFRELEIIALAKAYQDAAGFYLRKPTRLDQTTTTQA